MSKAKDKTPAPAPEVKDLTPGDGKGLPVFTMHDCNPDSKAAPRRIVFDFELGAVLADSNKPGVTVVYFGGNSYEIDAPLEEAVDELLAVTVTVAPSPVNVQQGEVECIDALSPPGFQAPASDESQQQGTGQEQSQA